jgi:hypothetical protein
VQLPAYFEAPNSDFRYQFSRHQRPYPKLLFAQEIHKLQPDSSKAEKGTPADKKR